MRSIIQWALVPVAILAIACRGENKAPTAMNEDLKRDLQLASATKDITISPDEVAPKAHQEMALKPKRAPQGPKVIRTANPTVKASAAPVEAAELPTEIPQVQVMAVAAAPSETPSAEPPPLARPTAVQVSYPGAAPLPGSGNGGGSAGGGSSGGILGGIFGAVIRGGMVGDDDHCDPRSTPRRPGGPNNGMPGGYRMPGTMSSPGPIGIGGMRTPVGIARRSGRM